jgi:RNA polymerase sigma factor (sigma-70 family)
MRELAAMVMTHKREQNIVQAVQAYGKRLFSFIRGRVNSDEDAEDILQEVWYQLSRAVDVEQIEQLSAWLFRVARSKIIDSYRKQKPKVHFKDLADEAGESSIEEILFVDPNTPETEHLRGFFWQELFAALDELPEEQKQVFIWNELEDMTFQEIADRTGENIKTLISRKRYAVRHLRERLENLYDEIIDH